MFVEVQSCIDYIERARLNTGQEANIIYSQAGGMGESVGVKTLLLRKPTGKHVGRICKQDLQMSPTVE